MPHGVRTDPNVTAKFLALTLTGAPIERTAKQLGLPISTAYQLYRTNVGKKTEAYDLLVLQLLGANLRAGLTQVELLGDEDFVRKNVACISSLAISYGILTDKAVRVLEARPNSGPAGPGSDLDGPAAAEDVPPGA